MLAVFSNVKALISIVGSVIKDEVDYICTLVATQRSVVLPLASMPVEGHMMSHTATVQWTQ